VPNRIASLCLVEVKYLQIFLFRRNATNIFVDVFILCLKARLYDYHCYEPLSLQVYDATRNMFVSDQQEIKYVCINTHYSFLIIRDEDEIIIERYFLRNAFE